MTVRDSIKLISPNGIPFVAEWVGDERTKSKKLGIFSPPLVSGSIVQDLDINAPQYPLTLYFTGQAAALSARLFWSAFDEQGVWVIIHPVLGSLKLQPVTITDSIQPVNDVQRRVFQTEWILPIDEGAFAGISSLLAIVDAATSLADASAAAAYVANIKQATFGEVQTLKNSVLGSVASVKQMLGASSRDSSIPSEMDEIEAGIVATLETTPISGTSLAVGLQKFIRLPSLGMTSVDEGFQQYTALITSNLETGPQAADNEGLNEIATQELTLSACNSTLAQISTISGLSTRAEAIGFAEQIIDGFANITAILDETQVLYQDIRIDNQYFSQSKSYNDSAILTARAAQYLLNASLDLKVEKRFKLSREMSPLVVTVQEYGTLGEGDANYHQFVDSNKLKGDEILVLPAGREVVVYV